MGNLVMGYWDCPVCGSKEIRGDVVNCPSCGRARGDVKFYLKTVREGEIREENQRSDIEYLTEEQAKYVSKNPDWYCSFCNSLNSDNAQTCNTCGAGRADSESNYFDQLKKAAGKGSGRAGRPAPGFLRRAEALPQSPGHRRRNPPGHRGPVRVDERQRKTVGDLRVTALNWSRAITIEENRLFSESDWELPAGAEKRTAGGSSITSTASSTTTRAGRCSAPAASSIITKPTTPMRDNGNGTFTEVPHQRPVYTTGILHRNRAGSPCTSKVPRYATKYYYNIRRWTPSREVTSSGEDHNTAWPEFTLAENEREGERRREYPLHRGAQRRKTKSPATYAVGEEFWNTLNVGDQMYITAKPADRTPTSPTRTARKSQKYGRSDDLPLLFSPVSSRDQRTPRQSPKGYTMRRTWPMTMLRSTAPTLRLSLELFRWSPIMK